MSIWSLLLGVARWVVVDSYLRGREMRAKLKAEEEAQARRVQWAREAMRASATVREDI